MPPTCAYDEIPYPSLVHDQTHPDLLRTRAALFGLKPAPASRCTYLEIGCGDGLNLATLAAAYPDSRFVGIDLSKRAIDAGRALVAEAGLSNVELIQADLLRWPPRQAPKVSFDYVVAHGFLSWVPKKVQTRFWKIVESRLAPGGVAFVSYLARPGADLRALAADLMARQARHFRAPLERYEQGLALLRLAAGALETAGSWQRLLSEQFALLRPRQPEAVLHDELGPQATAWFFSDICSQAGRAGLTFVSESEYSETRLAGGSAEANHLLESLRGDRTHQEQYFDYLTGRRFRQSLFCRTGSGVSTEPNSGLLRKLWFAARLERRDTPDGPVYTSSVQPPLPIRDPVCCAALDTLGPVWPSALSWVTMVRGMCSRLGRKPKADELRRVEALLLHLHVPTLVEIWSEPPPIDIRVKARPRATALARLLANRGSATVNLRLERVDLDSEERKLIANLDGRTRLNPALRPVAERLARLGLLCRD
jgi:SAM-dependent methyltransferase